MQGPPDIRSPQVSRWSRLDAFAITAITTVAGVIRLVRLDDPKVLMFDETYYAKDACWYVMTDPSLCGVHAESSLVHPPFAKWLIALGIRLFGYDSFGWRISAAVAGTLTVALLFLLVRKLLRSTVGASVAAGLLAIDLLHVVESRIAMLDIFVPLFGLAAVLFIVYDREQLNDADEGGAGNLLARPWRLAAGLATGLAVASKWSGGFFFVLVIVLTLAWETQRRRKMAVHRPRLTALREEGASIAVWLIIVPVLVYSFTYVGRLHEPIPRYDGTDRACPWKDGHWAYNLVNQQICMLNFHKTLTSNHTYQSPAWSWLALKRPVAYYFEVGPNDDYKEVLATGSPLVWWTSLIALIAVALRWVRRRHSLDAEGLILSGFMFTYVPWLVAGIFADRAAVFIFYLLPTIPFMCLALGYVASCIGRSWEAKAAIGLFSAAAIWFFVFYYPLLTKVPIPQPQWDKRIWLFDNCDKPATDATTSVVTEITEGVLSTRTTFMTTLGDDLPPKGWCWI